MNEVIRRSFYNVNRVSAGKLIFKAVTCAFIICAVLSMTSFSAQSQSISESILRVHIIANSDSEKDQSLKLKVRDMVQKLCYNIYSENDTGTLEQAEAVISDNLGYIEECVQQEVYAQGFDYTASAELVNMYFTNRTYGDITLPAGYYDAVRIVLGEGKGHNWWCVMFPPICIGAAENKAEISDVLNEKQTDTVTNGSYVYKFKIYEIYCDLSEKLNGK